MPTKGHQTSSLFPWGRYTVPVVEKIVERAKAVHGPMPGYRPCHTAEIAVGNPTHEFCYLRVPSQYLLLTWRSKKKGEELLSDLFSTTWRATVTICLPLLSLDDVMPNERSGTHVVNNVQKVRSLPVNTTLNRATAIRPP